MSHRETLSQHCSVIESLASQISVNLPLHLTCRAFAMDVRPAY